MVAINPPTHTLPFFVTITKYISTYRYRYIKIYINSINYNTMQKNQLFLDFFPLFTSKKANFISSTFSRLLLPFSQFIVIITDLNRIHSFYCHSTSIGNQFFIGRLVKYKRELLNSRSIGSSKYKRQQQPIPLLGICRFAFSSLYHPYLLSCLHPFSLAFTCVTNLCNLSFFSLLSILF